MTGTVDKNIFIREYSDAIVKSRAALFVGSGLSRAVTDYDWKSILRQAAMDIGLDVDREEHDLISLAQYYVNSVDRININNAISDCFKTLTNPGENHQLLAALPITSYWTTNYDKLLEKAFENQNIPFSWLTDDLSLQKPIKGTDVILRKLHGDVDTPSKCVITKFDYENFDKEHEILMAQLKGEMCSKSFLFLGYSFSDTDINHILTKIRLCFGDSYPQRHYCIMAKTKADDYKKKKLEHHIASLKKYGIYTVLVDDYSEITEMLKEIRHSIYKKNVYISGAYEKTDPRAVEYAQYAHEISKWLIENEYKIYTGYGKNLGAEVVAGGFEGCLHIKDNEPTKKFNENVFLFPFPFRSTLPENERKQINTEQRKNSILHTHVTILINGTNNTTPDGSFQNAPGCLEEAEISTKQGNLVIPIGVTGGVAKQVWDEMNTVTDAYKSSEAFQKLNNGASYDETFNAIKTIIEA